MFTYVFIDNENSYFFTLLYVGGTYARLVCTWYKIIFRMIVVLIVFIAANKEYEYDENNIKRDSD